MHRPSDHLIFLLWLLASFAPALIIIAGYFLTGSILLSLIAIILWLPIITTAFWALRRQRCGDAAPAALILAWVWGLGWLLLPWAIGRTGIDAGATWIITAVAGSLITCGVLWFMTRLRVPVLAGALGGLSLLTLWVAILLWPTLIYGGLAYWVASSAPSPSRPRRTCACGYSLRGLPITAICPECGAQQLPPDVAAAFTAFINATREHHEAMQARDDIAARSAADEQIAAFRRIADCGPEARERLIDLIDEHDPLIAGAAAAYTLAFNEAASSRILRRLARRHDLVGTFAQLSLENWSRGRWPMEQPQLGGSGAGGS